MIRVKYSKFSKELIYLRHIYNLPFITLTILCNDHNLASNIKYNKECILDKDKVDKEIQSIKNHCNNLYNFLCITPQNTKEYKTKMLLFIDKSPIKFYKASINIKIWRTKINEIDLDFLKEEHRNLCEIYEQLNIKMELCK